MNQADFRVRADGVIEYRYQVGHSSRRHWESWEPVAIHAARHMAIPPEYLQGLRAAGYSGGSSLLDLLQAEGWLVEKEEYLEATPQPVLESGVKPVDIEVVRRIAAGPDLPSSGSPR
jgi:hypothetical protein